MPVDYQCIDPSQASLVFDFITGLRQDEMVEVQAHLGLCLRCREAVKTMRMLADYLDRPHFYYLHPAGSDEAESAACAGSFTEIA